MDAPFFRVSRTKKKENAVALNYFFGTIDKKYVWVYNSFINDMVCVLCRLLLFIMRYDTGRERKKR